MNSIKRQLRELKCGEINPREEWLRKNRAVLLSQIKNTISVQNKSRRSFASFASLEKLLDGMAVFLPRVFVFKVIRPAMVVLLIIVLGGGSWIATVAASQDSLPGELLYPAKIATEKTQAVVAAAVGAKETETKLHVDFAKRRAQETKKLIVSKNPEKIKKVPETVNNLK